MDLTLATSLLVFLVGLVILCVQRRFNEVWGGMFLAGLIACLLQFVSRASIHIR